MSCYIPFEGSRYLKKAKELDFALSECLTNKIITVEVGFDLIAIRVKDKDEKNPFRHYGFRIHNNDNGGVIQALSPSGQLRETQASLDDDCLSILSSIQDFLGRVK